MTLQQAKVKVATQTPTWQQRFSAVIFRIAKMMEEADRPGWTELDRGDVAMLRRLGREGLAVPAFWRIVVNVLEPQGMLPGERDPRRLEVEDRWARIIASMARSVGFHESGLSFGKALAMAEVKELRLIQLLEGRAKSLYETIEALVALLGSKGQSFDWSEPAQLILGWDRPDRAEWLRRKIARDYYRNMREESPRA